MLILTPIELDRLLREVVDRDGVEIRVSGAHLPEILLRSGETRSINRVVTDQDIRSWRRDLLGKYERDTNESTIIEVFSERFSVTFRESEGYITLTGKRLG